MLYEYATSSVAVVTAVDVITVGSFVLLTVTVKTWSVSTVPSLALIVTLWTPTSALVGVPLKVAVPSPLSVSVNHAGNTGAVIVGKSPSSSDVVMLYEYATSSMAVVTAVLVITV